MEELTTETPVQEESLEPEELYIEEYPDVRNDETEADELPENDNESFDDAEDGGSADYIPDADDESGSETDYTGSSDEESGTVKTYPESGPHPSASSETVSGNDADYPHFINSDTIEHSYESFAVTEASVELLERQNDILYCGFAGILFILGIIFGVLVMHGFRLRRV